MGLCCDIADWLTFWGIWVLGCFGLVGLGGIDVFVWVSGCGLFLLFLWVISWLCLFGDGVLVWCWFWVVVC